VRISELGRRRPLVAVLALVTSLVSLNLLGAPPPPASAATSVILTTNGDGTGYGEAGAMLTWPNRRSVRLRDIWVNDYCGSRGGDGRGIYFRGRATTRSDSGKWRKHSLGLIGRDDNGCGSTPMRFDAKRWTKASKIVYVELWLCEEDHDDSGSRCLTASSIKTFRNPKR
jgi:hypothetical protein